jgi:hypothetical protein
VRKKRRDEARGSKPMDIGTYYSEIACNTLKASITREHFHLGETGLGKMNHSKSNAITILDSFVFYKTKGRVVKQSYKKLELLRVLELTSLLKHH